VVRNTRREQWIDSEAKWKHIGIGKIEMLRKSREAQKRISLELEMRTTINIQRGRIHAAESYIK